MAFNPIAAIGAAGSVEAQAGHAAAAKAPSHAFAQMLIDGVNRVDQTIQAADAKVTAFALDDTIPPHQVMFELAQARQSLTVMMQVRARMVEGYQELMRMQL